MPKNREGATLCECVCVCVGPKNYIGAFQQYVSTKSTIQYNFFCVKQAVRDLEMLYDDMVPWELPGVLSITARFKTLSL